MFDAVSRGLVAGALALGSGSSLRNHGYVVRLKEEEVQPGTRPLGSKRLKARA